MSPGSSGSPVFNDNGLVIGIVTFSDAGEASQNLNFAPSCSAIKDFLKRKPMITRKEYKIQQRRKNPKDYHVAQKGDIIFKAGDYDYAKTIELLEPIKSTLPGALGIHFWFEITAPCELAYVYSYNNCDFYAAPSNLIKSTYMGASVIARGDLIGVLVDPKKNSFGWFVDNSHYNGGMRTIWTRGFKQKEFSKIRESSSLYFDNRGNVCIVSYEGIEEDNLIIRALQIKNGQKTNNTGEVEINLKRLPGEYIIAGGVLDVDKVENGFMYYDWTEYPK